MRPACCVKWQTRVPEVEAGRFSVRAASMETVASDEGGAAIVHRNSLSFIGNLFPRQTERG